jgi:hypothetical protein
MLADPISTDDALAFVGEAFRNIDLPPLSQDDLREIADALFFFALKHGPR